eukprot:6637452-Lingulodinium_polyedra.AAC.1
MSPPILSVLLQDGRKLLFNDSELAGRYLGLEAASPTALGATTTSRSPTCSTAACATATSRTAARAPSATKATDSPLGALTSELGTLAL